MEKHKLFASSSVFAFLHFIEINFEAPSPSPATLLAKFRRTSLKAWRKFFNFESLKSFIMDYTFYYSWDPHVILFIKRAIPSPNNNSRFKTTAKNNIVLPKADQNFTLSINRS